MSQQATRAAKDELRRVVQEVIEKASFFLTGEVQISVEWFVHDRARYETDCAPDIDNILKPLLDSLCGPQGILVDDCQIQRVTCGWIDWEREDQALEVEIRHFDDELIESRSIYFVQFADGLCFPFDRSMPLHVVSKLVRHLQKMLAFRNEIVKETMRYRDGLSVMPIQRFFHRTRVRGFDVVERQQYADLGHGIRRRRAY